MKQEALRYFTDTHLTVIGLTIFFGYFLMVLFKAFSASKNQINHLQNIPFNSEDIHGK